MDRPGDRRSAVPPHDRRAADAGDVRRSVAFVLRNTAWGRHVYAVGDDREAARLAGIAVQSDPAERLHRRRLHLRASPPGSSSAGSARRARTPATDANLDSITAVVIGGTSLFGGRGIMVGSLIGALIVGVFRNGLALAGVDVLYQTLAIGVLVIVAVATDQWIRRVRA